MTAKEVIMYGNEGYSFRDVINNHTEGDILDCMHEYAQIKCQELLSVVADGRVRYKNGKVTGIITDKESLINFTNLKDFCTNGLS